MSPGARSSDDHLLKGLLSVLAVALAWSGWRPYDRLTWALEVAPIFIAVPLLLRTRRSFPLTRLVYVFLFLHALLLIGGGYSTYARQPLGEAARVLFHLQRNPYDRLGHFMQGFVPALVAREFLLRRTPLRRGKTLFFLVFSVCMMLSACYELIEWASALLLGQSADDFLGTQGDPWDTQWDMFMAFVGSVTAQLALARAQDRQMETLGKEA